MPSSVILLQRKGISISLLLLFTLWRYFEAAAQKHGQRNYVGNEYACLKDVDYAIPASSLFRKGMSILPAVSIYAKQWML